MVEHFVSPQSLKFVKLQTYITILRGINVGGKKLIKMQALKELCESQGFINVKTYIQSGNVVFTYKKEDVKTIAIKISKKILKTFGYEVPVITFTNTEIADVIKNNSLAQNKKLDSTFFHVTFLAEKPIGADVIKLQENNFAPDVFVVKDKAVYLYCPNGYSNSKLTNTFIEKKLKTTATTRNWKTVNELFTLAPNL